MARTTERFPWFPFYAADWLSSPRVLAMTLEQRGCYMTLLAIAWNRGGEEPSISAEPRVQATSLGLPAARWRRISSPVVACFDVRECEPGKLYNAKLSEVWEVQRAKYELAALAGKASGMARGGNRTPTDGQRTFNGRSPHVGTERPTERQRKGNHTDADTDTRDLRSSPLRGGASLESLVPSARDAIAGTRKT